MTSPNDLQHPTIEARPQSSALPEFLGIAEDSTEHLYLDNAALLRRIAIRRFGVPEEDASTLVHDVFLTFIASPPDVRTNARAYLIGAIKHASQKYWRSRQSDRRVFAEDDLSEDGPLQVHSPDFLEGLSANQLVAAVFQRISSRCKEALCRYYLNGEDTVEIAVALDTTPGNVNYIMFNCRRKAKEIYQSLIRRSS